MTRQPILNPDSVCSAELRAEAAELAMEIENAIDPFRDLCKRGAAMKCQLLDASKPAVSDLLKTMGREGEDGAWVLVEALSGFTPIFEALSALSQIADYASERSDPEMVERSGRGLAYWQVEGKAHPPYSIFEMLHLEEALRMREQIIARIAELQGRGEVSQ